MATTTKAKILTEIEGKKVYETPTGLKVGAKGKVMSPFALAFSLPKGTRRQLRKAFARINRPDLVQATLLHNNVEQITESVEAKLAG